MLKVIQFRAEGCYSYVVYDDLSKEAVAVDPVLSLCKKIDETERALGLKSSI